MNTFSITNPKAFDQKKGSLIKPGFIQHKQAVSPVQNSSMIFRKPICSCDGGCPICQPKIQTKLTIGKPNDRYEEEADQIADRIMRMPDAECPTCDEEEKKVQTKPIAEQITLLFQRQEEVEEEELVQPKRLGSTVLLQRQAEEEEEEEAETLQTKRTGGNAPRLLPDLHACIQSFKGGGRPLSKAERSIFEPRFGYNFAHVNIHTDTQAAKAARAVNANAFTIGRHIVFAVGRYQPSTTRGKRLLAHELTHVVQQWHSPSKTPKLQRQDKPSVWAWRGGVGLWKKAGKWNVAVNFYNFKSLLSGIKKYKNIQRLAILAHGDIGGMVQIPIPEGKKARGKAMVYKFMSPYTIRSFSAQFKELNKHLASNAYVIFYGCISGLGCAGDYLLKEISKSLRGKTIVGFTTIGFMKGMQVEKQLAGRVFEAKRTMSTLSPAQVGLLRELRDINSDFAKHAKNGKIVRRPRKPKEEVRLRCVKWRPSELKFKDVKVFDLLKQDPNLYYFGILFFGWWGDKSQKKHSPEDYRRGWRELEKALKLLANKYRRLPSKKISSGIKIGYSHIFVKPKKLTQDQQHIYNRLKQAMETQRHREWVPWVWAQQPDLAGIRKVIVSLLKKAGIRKSRRKKVKSR